MDFNHPGPLLAHLSKVPAGGDIHTYDGSGEWVKIHSVGLEVNDDGSLHWLAYNYQGLPSRVRCLFLPISYALVDLVLTRPSLFFEFPSRPQQAIIYCVWISSGPDFTSHRSMWGTRRKYMPAALRYQLRVMSTDRYHRAF